MKRGCDLLTLLAFAEVVIDQIHQCLQRLISLFTFGAQVDSGALARSEHHHCHDAFSVDRGFRRASYSDRAILEPVSYTHLTLPTTPYV